MGRLRNAWTALTRRSSESSEIREGDFGQTVIDLILQQASGTASPPIGTIAPVEVAAGIWGRAFMSATIEPQSALTRAFSAPLRNMVGRAMVKQGEILMRLEVTPVGIALIPATSFDVTGPESPLLWSYNANFQGPNNNRKRRLARAEVAVFTYATDPDRPQHGISPLEYAKLTGQLARNVTDLIKKEHNSPIGNVIPIPEDGAKETLDSLKTTIKGLNGRTALVETTAGGWGDGVSNSPVQDWASKRIGPSPDKVTAELYQMAYNHILAACGVPPVLAAEGGDGTSKREAWRQFLHGTLTPVAQMVEEELGRLFEQKVTLNFDKLFASDIQGRARAFGSLVQGGMDGATAAEQTGFDYKEAENVLPMAGQGEEDDDDDADDDGDGSDDGEEKAA